MIARIRGRILERSSQRLVIDSGGIAYEVFIPATVMRHFQAQEPADGTVELYTYHYYHVEPSRSVPVLIGFLNEVEKDFFLTFITVSGIGPRAALRAMDQPISLIARAIDEGDVAFLKSLPGIGQQRAREIVAKLQSKIGKFGLVQDGHRRAPEPALSDAAEEALAVLLQLEYKKPEAVEMIKKALQRSGGLHSAEEILNEVYRQKKGA